MSRTEGGIKMKLKDKKIVVFLSIILLLALAAYCPSISLAAKAAKPSKKEKVFPGSVAEKFPKINAFNDPSKLSDMSDFDPAKPIIPTGDTIKIALVQAYSGHSAQGGEITYAYAYWAVHDINKRGGIWVDGKKKLIELIKADNNSNADQCKKVCERMVLQEKVHVLWGANGSIMTKIMNDVANKYKIIAQSSQSWGDHLMDAENFGRYTFHSMVSTEQLGRGMAYYYGQIRKKEKKFYILCQDYSFGHSMADGFKKGLKEHFPEAQIVGEDYHKLFLMDFAPYLEKIKASGAEVIYTADWRPDSETLLLQARQMGIKIPFAHFYIDEPNTLNKVGVEGTKDLVQLSQYGIVGGAFKTPGQTKYFTAWNNLWKAKWKDPYNTPSYQHLASTYGVWADEMYWLLSVIERAKSTDPEKIIKVWENDTYQYANGKIVKMRACDHKAIQDLTVFEFVPPDEQKLSYNIPPYKWYDKASYWGPSYFLPAAKILPWMDQKLDRCKGKNDWGE
jgi:branched-chain amino acid transport system substrate-binding protein